MLTGLARMLAVELGSEAALHSLLDELVTSLHVPALAPGCVRLEKRSVHQVEGWGCRILFQPEGDPAGMEGEHGQEQSHSHEHAHGHSHERSHEHVHSHVHRSYADICSLIHNSALPAEAQKLALRAFALLAEAEAAVHGKKPAEVSFHEVGALDSIVDMCLVAALFARLQVARFVCSPLPLADGSVHCAHGCLPVPAPAVLHMLEHVPVCGFAGQGETVTPTALALLKALGAEFGPWPSMTIRCRALVYGDKVFAHAPNGAIWALGPALAPEPKA